MLEYEDSQSSLSSQLNQPQTLEPTQFEEETQD